MFHWHRRISTALFILSVSLLLWSPASFILYGRHARLEFQPAELLVEGDVGERVRVDLTIKNTGKNSIVLIGAYQLCTSVGCIEVLSGFPAELAPEESTEVHALIRIGSDTGQVFLWPIYTNDSDRPTVYLPIKKVPS
jgi:hypothetical protein